MPVIRMTDILTPPDREERVARIARELSTDPAARPEWEPLIVERQVHPTGRFSVVVVWSAWKGTHWSERTRIIADAYRRFDSERPEAVPRVALLATATGWTWDEADDAQFFTFAVRLGDGSAPSPMTDDAMIAAGGVRTDDGVKLRFFSERDAKVALNEVIAAAPRVNWRLYRIPDSAP